jgi:quercetin dioxygenase-like cupin family protein
MTVLRWLPFCLLSLPGVAAAQDLVQVAPAIARVEYEDTSIRVIRSHYEPGTASPMHSHPPRIVIALKSGTLRLSKPDGSSVVPPVYPLQRPLALGPETHEVANIGNTPVENIEIEFKQQPRLGTLRTKPGARNADPLSLLNEPHHRWLMETSFFRVVDARIPPGETTQWHRHACPTVSVRIQGSRISVQKQGGEWTPPQDLPSGAVSFDNTAQPYVHRVKNSGSGEYHVVMVELPDGDARQCIGNE